MTSADLIREIVANYQRHGWQLRRILLRAESRKELGEATLGLFEDAEVLASDMDALWFARQSHEGREAWELRLVAEQAYALFEAFEKDEPEEARADVRREMEDRLREQTVK